MSRYKLTVTLSIANVNRFDNVMSYAKKATEEYDIERPVIQHGGRDGGKDNVSDLLIAAVRCVQRSRQEFAGNPSHLCMMRRAARRNAPSLMHGRRRGVSAGFISFIFVMPLWGRLMSEL